jgi:hypothetical protein
MAQGTQDTQRRPNSTMMTTTDDDCGNMLAGISQPSSGRVEAKLIRICRVHTLDTIPCVAAIGQGAVEHIASLFSLTIHAGSYSFNLLICPNAAVKDWLPSSLLAPVHN